MARDERMRELERASALGDAEASEALELAESSAGIPRPRILSPPCEPAEWARDLSALLMGEDSGDECWLFSFGAYGWTRILVIGGSLEGGLETCAGWLAENEPGHLVQPEYPAEMQAIESSGRAEFGQTWSPWEDERFAELAQEAEADLTYTESGWLHSWEWHVNEVAQDVALASALSRALFGDADAPEDRGLIPIIVVATMWEAWSSSAGDVLGGDFRLLPRRQAYFPPDWERDEVEDALIEPSEPARKWHITYADEPALFAGVTMLGDSPLGEDSEDYAQAWTQVDEWLSNRDDDELWARGALELLRDARFLAKGEDR